MDVLQEILNWSEDRPLWQRDALRRLIEKGTIEEQDYNELLNLCKSVHGLSEIVPSEPLNKDHIPKRVSISKSVALKTLTHHAGVNALALNQTVSFGPGLTIVYGQNAAGKSGYTRVLKRACRARGSEEVLSNVLLDSAPVKPSVTLAYLIEDSQHSWNWTDTKEQNSELGQVSVFDRHCATVYLDERTDVAFRPFGLDLFDKLSLCCEKLKVILEKERSNLSGKSFESNVHESTKSARLIENITSLTNLEEIKIHARLSAEEKLRQSELQRQLQDLRSQDPEKTKKTLALKFERIKSFRIKLQQVAQAFSQVGIDSISKIQGEILSKEGQLNELKSKIEKVSQLNGTGSTAWGNLWLSASEFSKVAYHGKPFPLVEENANCVFCQQKLSDLAKERLVAFSNFMESDAQKELVEAKQKLQNEIDALGRLQVEDLNTSDVMSEIQIDEPDLIETLRAEIKIAKEGIEKISQSVKASKSIINLEVKSLESIHKVDAMEKSAEQRLKSLSQGTKKGELENLDLELKELNARDVLLKEIPSISREIERKKRFAAYSLCIDDVGTSTITRKSTEVTKKTVTEQLSGSFQLELKRLGFNHLEIELQPYGGSRGTLFHKLVIKRAASIRVQNVVSEGEARALSIAAFFSELSTSTNTSAILFDDPVSSLDHYWREKVAARLVEEAKVRQVIVFTHDVVFLNSLKRIAEELKVDCLHQYIHREFQGAGVSSVDLPWVAMKIKDRIGALNKMWQEAEKIERTGSKDEYASKAIQIYGYLREAWERALEEVLINGVIERYRPSIQSLQIKNLSDITENDCNVFYDAMTKCSRWLPGHDNAPAENAPVPGSEELKNDISVLESWVKSITVRRKK